jgi:DNA-3-methyladenine glycosylase
VYSIHAKYCLNAVTQPTGEGAAVLIRALQPLWGVETMKRLRNQQELRRLTAGPAMLCQALRIERRDDGRCLTTDPEIGIFETQEALPAGRTSVGQANAGQTPPRVVATKRIGISKAAHRNLRFIDPASAFLSRPHRAK